MKGKTKHIIAAMCSIVLTVITVLSPLAGQEVFAASWVMSDTTINEGQTVNYDDAYTLREGGCLADIAPTLIQIMGLEQPAEMTGKSLLVRK